MVANMGRRVANAMRSDNVPDTAVTAGRWGSATFCRIQLPQKLG